MKVVSSEFMMEIGYGIHGPILANSHLPIVQLVVFRLLLLIFQQVQTISLEFVHQLLKVFYQIGFR